MRKDEITFRTIHSLVSSAKGRATVNIKVPWQPLDVAVKAAQCDKEIPETLTEEWIRENVNEDALNDYWEMACEHEYEYWCDWADEIMPGTTFEQEGRSGGWAVSNWDEDDVAGWDAIQVSRWAKIERVARSIAEGINYQVVMRVYDNDYAPENVYVDAVPIEEHFAGIA